MRSRQDRILIWIGAGFLGLILLDAVQTYGMSKNPQEGLKAAVAHTLEQKKLVFIGEVLLMEGFGQPIFRLENRGGEWGFGAPAAEMGAGTAMAADDPMISSFEACFETAGEAGGSGLEMATRGGGQGRIIDLGGLDMQALTEAFDLEEIERSRVEAQEGGMGIGPTIWTCYRLPWKMSGQDYGINVYVDGGETVCRVELCRESGAGDVLIRISRETTQ